MTTRSRYSTFFLSVLMLPALVMAQNLRYSPDITITPGGVTMADKDVAHDDLAGGVIIGNIGSIPAGADLMAYHLLPSGAQLLAFDTTVILGGVTVQPGDVVSYDGALYNIVFDASAEGVPAGARVDALASDGTDLLLSFDTTVTVSGETIDDADLVQVAPSGFVLYFDSALAGVPAGMDLDAAAVDADGILYVSFDISGSLAGVDFDDEDTLTYDSGTSEWMLAYDGDAQHADWAAADLDALALVGEISVAPGDSDGDGDIDSIDIRSISVAARNNTPAAPGDPRDVDGNGVINYNDVRAAMRQCTLPRCIPVNPA